MTKRILKYLLVLSVLLVVAGPSYSQKRSSFEITVDTLIEQVDIQMQDRSRLIALVNELYSKLKDSERDALDALIGSARLSAIQRDALVTADRMIQDPKNMARVTELVAYLDRIVKRDQELYDQYVSSKESVRFEYERQLAKIKSEQTLLKGIRKDLERI